MSSPSETVKTALFELFKKKSYSEVSRATGVAVSYLNSLNNGIADIRGLTLGRLEKIFPFAKLDINGTDSTAKAGGIPLSRAEEKLVEIFRTIPEDYRMEAVMEFTRFAPTKSRFKNQIGEVVPERLDGHRLPKRTG